MELKVWVEGIQRIVCGVTESTTCQDVVYALAHATGKTGRFTLIERWRHNERLLAPQEHPLKVVSKWGEYSSEVQLILQRSGNCWNDNNSTASNTQTNTSLGSSSDNKNKKNVTNNNVQLQITASQNINQHSSHNVQKDISSPKKEFGSLTPAKYQQEINKSVSNIKDNNSNNKDETIVYNAHYRNLLRLVNCQREKLSVQQTELNKCDAEIVFWESKNREQQQQIEFMAQEAARYEATINNNELKLKALNGVEEEKELIQQQERTLKSELTLLRSKLANCETELLQCKNKIRILSEELEMEEKWKDEISVSKEVERIRNELEQAKQGAETAAQAAENVRSQVANLEIAIIEKKKQVEKLIQDMKEANLESLAISPAEEIKLLLEGPHKPGSTRRMIGSPRQLENAVPTSKNPHGVWV